MELLTLSWTDRHGHRLGEIVLQHEGIFVYKTAKKLLYNADSFRDIVYAELMWCDVDFIRPVKRFGGYGLLVKISLEKYHTILAKHHSSLDNHLSRLLTDSTLFLPTYKDDNKDVLLFGHIANEKILANRK